MQTIGIIGLGSFGSFVASKAPDKTKVFGYDINGNAKHPKAVVSQLAIVAKCNVVILAVPLESYPVILKKLSKLLSPETLIIDTCSVKSIPQEYFDKYLPGHPNILMTHPLFGPQSASKSTKGHRLIVTRKNGNKAEAVLDYCKIRLGLDIKEMSAAKHDKIMARVHVLTFFVARGLSSMPPQKDVFITPSYGMLVDLVKFDHSHSQELFSTIQEGNPYAKQVRKQFIDALLEIDEKI
jgi:prephenate dehydrogenase